GVQSPFSQSSYETSMSNNSENTDTTTLGMPLRNTAIDAVIEHNFQKPAHFPRMFYISVHAVTYEPVKHKG
ncbi:MAG: hypothetical protein ACKPKO_05620, partial [Candidatus Fonsibacter sp.]